MEIRDLGSLHGTYINDDEERIQRKGVRELKDGDYIKFGVPISRGEEQFQPTKVKVGIEFDHRSVLFPVNLIDDHLSADTFLDLGPVARLEFPRAPTTGQKLIFLQARTTVPLRRTQPLLL